jgi:hypothetical protein
VELLGSARGQEGEGEEEEGRQTEEVEASRAPRWAHRRFKFSVSPLHHYLNVCVYDRLPPPTPLPR